MYRWQGPSRVRKQGTAQIWAAAVARPRAKTSLLAVVLHIVSGRFPQPDAEFVAPVELPALPEPPVPPSLPDDPSRVVDCHVLISEEGDATVAVDESAEVKAAAEAFEAAQEAYAAAQEAYQAEMAAAAAAAAAAEAAAAEEEVEFLRVDEVVAAHLFDTLVEHVEKVRAERAAAEAVEAARLEAEQLEQVRPLSASDCHPNPVVAARAGASSECPLIASD